MIDDTRVKKQEKWETPDKLAKLAKSVTLCDHRGLLLFIYVETNHSSDIIGISDKRVVCVSDNYICQATTK